MKIQQLLLLASILTALCLLLSGCGTANPEDTQIPWSRPAPWENSAPGFGGPSYGGH